MPHAISAEVTRLGQTVRAIRSARGIPLSQLCIRVGVTPGHLSNIEAGRRRPAPALVEQIAYHLGVPCGALVPVDDLDRPLRETSSSTWEPTE